MEIQYQRLTERQLEAFIELRIGQLKEEGAEETMDLRPALRDYYSRHMADGTFVSWIALAGDRIVATSASPLWKSPRTLAVPAGRLGCCPACLPKRSTAAGGLPKRFCPRWWRKPGSTAAGRCRLQPLTWECSSIQILVLSKTRTSCSTGCEPRWILS